MEKVSPKLEKALELFNEASVLNKGKDLEDLATTTVQLLVKNDSVKSAAQFIKNFKVVGDISTETNNLRETLMNNLFDKFYALNESGVDQMIDLCVFGYDFKGFRSKVSPFVSLFGYPKQNFELVMGVGKDSFKDFKISIKCALSNPCLDELAPMAYEIITLALQDTLENLTGEESLFKTSIVAKCDEIIRKSGNAELNHYMIRAKRGEFSKLDILRDLEIYKTLDADVLVKQGYFAKVSDANQVKEQLKLYAPRTANHEVLIAGKNTKYALIEATNKTIFAQPDVEYRAQYAAIVYEKGDALEIATLEQRLGKTYNPKRNFKAEMAEAISSDNNNAPEMK